MVNIKLGVLLTLATSGIVCAASLAAPLQSDAATMRVTKSYRMDLNTYSNTLGNYHAYKYANIPTSARYTSYSKYRVGSGWNYIRYERLNHFGKY